MNDVYRVDTRDTAYILKLLAQPTPMRAIQAEVNFLNDLLDPIFLYAL